LKTGASHCLPSNACDPTSFTTHGVRHQIDFHKGENRDAVINNHSPTKAEHHQLSTSEQMAIDTLNQPNAPQSSRLRSPRPTKSGRRCPAYSEALKKLWATPEYREKMVAARQRSAEDRRNSPQKYSRLGVPNGMRKAEAMKAWETARTLADTIMSGFEAQGIVPGVVIPDSDEEKANRDTTCLGRPTRRWHFQPSAPRMNSLRR
jgi:hypothetical protein